MEESWMDSSWRELLVLACEEVRRIGYLGRRSFGPSRDEDDFAQEVLGRFLRAYPSPARLKYGRPGARSLIRLIAIQLAGEWSAHYHRERGRIAPGVEPDDFASPAAEGPLESAVRLDSIRQLDACLEQIPELGWQILERYYWRGLKHDRIATELGIPTSTAYGVYRRTMEQLKELL